MIDSRSDPHLSDVWLAFGRRLAAAAGAASALAALFAHTGVAMACLRGAAVLAVALAAAKAGAWLLERTARANDANEPPA